MLTQPLCLLFAPRLSPLLQHPAVLPISQPLSDITESRGVPFNSQLKLSSPDMTQYIPKLLLLHIIFIIYLFHVGSFSLSVCLPSLNCISKPFLNKWRALLTRGAYKLQDVSCLVVLISLWCNRFFLS